MAYVGPDSDTPEVRRIVQMKDEDEIKKIRRPVEMFFGRMKQAFKMSAHSYKLDHTHFDADMDSMILLANELIKHSPLNYRERKGVCVVCLILFVFILLILLILLIHPFVIVIVIMNMIVLWLCCICVCVRLCFNSLVTLSTGEEKANGRKQSNCPTSDDWIVTQCRCHFVMIESFRLKFCDYIK